MAKKLSASSRREKLKKVSGEHIYKITPKMQKELKKLTALSKDKIDSTDIPEITDWSNAVRGKFYRPVKKLVSIRLDMDILDWFKHADGKYQTLINHACREYMKRHQKTPHSKI